MSLRLFLFAILSVVAGLGSLRAAPPASAQDLAKSYQHWRAAMLHKSAPHWQQATARHRQIEIRNRLLSERRAFPGGVFELPGKPPGLDRLKLLTIHQRGDFANGVYFGPVDFGVGGKPTQNLLVVRFFFEEGRWTYDSAEFINLEILPQVRAELEGGKLSYVQQEAFFPNPQPPTPPVVLRGPVRYVAKVYVFCPGREVTVQVNRMSRHLFQNTRGAEVVIGGARDGKNTLEYRIKNIPGGTGQEALTIRVYLFSEVPGVKPVLAYQYQLAPGQPLAQPRADTNFEVTSDMVGLLMGIGNKK